MDVPDRNVCRFERSCWSSISRFRIHESTMYCPIGDELAPISVHSPGLHWLSNVDSERSSPSEASQNSPAAELSSRRQSNHSPADVTFRPAGDFIHTLLSLSPSHRLWRDCDKMAKSVMSQAINGDQFRYKDSVCPSLMHSCVVHDKKHRSTIRESYIQCYGSTGLSNHTFQRHSFSSTRS